MKIRPLIRAAFAQWYYPRVFLSYRELWCAVCPYCGNPAVEVTGLFGKIQLRHHEDETGYLCPFSYMELFEAEVKCGPYGEPPHERFHPF